MGKLIIEKGKDIWETKTGIVLIPVNCEGVMGLGLAKECKERFPLVYRSYRKRCKSGNFNLLTLDFYLLRDDYALMLVPTKYEWRHGSRVEWVDNVLYKFSRCLSRSPIKTLHVPPLGCGAGGLVIDDVLPLVERHLCQDGITVHFYQPN